MEEEKIKAIQFKDNALNDLDICISKHIDKEEFKQSNNLSKWIKKFSKYHNVEKMYHENSLSKYKRGEIVQLDFGYNIGNEFGGLHFAIILNKKDNNKNGVLTVVPLTSKKRDYKYNISLKNEVYEKITENLNNLEKDINEYVSKIKLDKNLNELLVKEIEKFADFQIEIINESRDFIKIFNKESFALINQITTISKQRIYKRNYLGNVRISSSMLDTIDKEMSKFLLK